MLDIRLITVIPPPAAVTQPPAAQNVSTQGAAILAQLPTGSVLSGFIINRDATGNPILRTETGDVLFTSNLFLKIGSEVVIRVQQQGGQTNAHLVSVNGLPPEVAATQSAFADEPEFIVGERTQPAPPQASSARATTLPATATTPTTAQPPAPVPGQTLSAIVVTPPATPLPGKTTIQPGTSFLLSVLAVNQTPETPANAALAQITAQPTAPSSSNALASLLPATPPPAAPAAPPPVIITEAAPPAKPLPPTTLPTTSQTSASVLSNQQAAIDKLPGPLGQTIIATVLAGSPDHHVTLSSPLGSLRIAHIGNLPVGNQLHLRVSSIAAPTPATITLANQAAPVPPAPLTELAGAWSSVQQLVQVLEESGLQYPISRFPTPPLITLETPARITQASSQVLFFIAALKGGNFREWLGTGNTKVLEDKGYGPLLRKAEGEFMQMVRQWNEPAPGNWQSAFIPVLAGGEWQQVRAFIKREKKKQEAERGTGDEDTRFVLEMELSQLGEMQMDGLVKRKESKVHFDLVIRSHEPLSRDLQQGIEAIYVNTAEITGYRGQIAFQAVYNFPVHPLEEVISDAEPDVLA